MKGEGIPFQRIRRITGYLVGSLERFNNATLEDILNTVEILRGITSQLNLRAGLEGMMTSMITPLFSMGSESLQQEVHITAEFPNVQSHEEAFKTLVNEASQYANRY